MSTDAPDPLIRHWYTRGYLPHHDLPGLMQLITFRQADSVPARLLRAYRAAIDAAKASSRPDANPRVTAHLEIYLAKGRGSCRLRDPRAAEIVENSLRFRDGKDYDLIAWVVMPNHVHVVIRRGPQAPLADITRLWKSWTARWINELFGLTGRFWFPRSMTASCATTKTSGARSCTSSGIRSRPGCARIRVDWRFSSAREHPERWGQTQSSVRSNPAAPGGPQAIRPARSLRALMPGAGLMACGPADDDGSSAGLMACGPATRAPTPPGGDRSRCRERRRRRPRGGAPESGSGGG